jgi:hypothetical protein
MKSIFLLMAICLLVTGLWAQGSEIRITPAISTTSIANIKMVASSAELSAAAKPFDGIAVGMHVYGVGIPANTTVLSLADPAVDSVITLSAACTKTIATNTLQFEKYTGLLYTTGDWLGLPFTIYENHLANINNLASISITGLATDTLGATDIVFFSSWSDSLGADNAAATMMTTDAHRITGVVSLTTTTTLGNAVFLSKDGVGLALAGGNLYGRLIARSAQHTAVTNPYLVRLRFK